MARLLLLEDETALREEMAVYLGKRGHTVEQAGTLVEFWPLMANAELAILDLMLPNGSGLDAAARLRVERPRVGIIILTALGTTRDKVAGLRGTVAAAWCRLASGPPAPGIDRSGRVRWGAFVS